MSWGIHLPNSPFSTLTQTCLWPIIHQNWRQKNHLISDWSNQIGNQKYSDPYKVNYPLDNHHPDTFYGLIGLRSSHTTRLAFVWFRDWYCDACMTSPCAQVFQSRDWLMGPLVRIWQWHVELSRYVVDIDRAFAMAEVKCVCASRGAQGTARVVCGVCFARMLAREMQSRTTTESCTCSARKHLGSG